MGRERITRKRLDAVCERLNTITCSPQEPWTEDGRVNIGNYHISGSYGGYALHRMDNASGGVADVLLTGHTTARDLYYQIHAYMAGYLAAEANTAQPAS